MKSIPNLSLILLIALFGSCSGGSGDLTRNGLKGKVKEYKEFHCDPTYDNDHWVASSSCENRYSFMEFDEEGYYLRNMTMSPEGDTLAMIVPKRENGTLVEEIFYGKENLTPKHSRFVPLSRTIMDRVSDKQENFEVWQNEQLRYEGATYYNSKGRVDRQVQVVNGREVTVHSIYEKGMLVEMYQEESDGRRSATQLYEYDGFDENGNWTLRLVYSGEEKIRPELAITRDIIYY